MSECANKGCTTATDVVVAFVDPKETERYCERCGVYEYQSNRKARAVVDEGTGLAALLTDGSDAEVDSDDVTWSDIDADTSNVTVGETRYQDVRPITDPPEGVPCEAAGHPTPKDLSVDLGVDDATQPDPPVSIGYDVKTMADRLAERDPETGEVLDHYEWNGWLWCENRQDAFDWETGDVECPHCGVEFHVAPPREEADG